MLFKCFLQLPFRKRDLKLQTSENEPSKLNISCLYDYNFYLKIAVLILKFNPKVKLVFKL